MRFPKLTASPASGNLSLGRFPRTSKGARGCRIFSKLCFDYRVCCGFGSVVFLFSFRFARHRETAGETDPAATRPYYPAALAGIGRCQTVRSQLHVPEDSSQVWSWNANLPLTESACIHNLIASRSSDYPDSPAVCSWDGNLTYQQLDRLSTCLSYHVVSLGVRPEMFLPLCFEKSTWTVIAMLGVLKAGATFVALNTSPSYPLSRLTHIVKDAGTALILASSRNARLCSSFVQNTVVVSHNTLVSMPEVVSISMEQAAPNNKAYAIYTSGTTGKPKGIVVTHAAYCTGARDHSRAMLLDSTARVLQFASYSFNISILETLITLLVGGCVCIPSEESRSMTIVETMRSMQVNWACLTPSYTTLIQPSQVPALKTLAFAGEPLTSSLLNTWADHCTLVNGYGPSECSVISTVNALLDPRGSPPNIGRADINFITTIESPPRWKKTAFRTNSHMIIKLQDDSPKSFKFPANISIDRVILIRPRSQHSDLL